MSRIIDIRNLNFLSVSGGQRHGLGISALQRVLENLLPWPPQTILSFVAVPRIAYDGCLFRLNLPGGENHA
jgi:hypothetical protein